MKALITLLSLICCGAAFGASNGSNGDYLLAELNFEDKTVTVYLSPRIFNSTARHITIAVAGELVDGDIPKMTVGWLSEDRAKVINGHFHKTTGTMHLVGITSQCSIAGCIDVGEEIITEVPLKPTGVGQFDVNLTEYFGEREADQAKRIVLRVALTTTKTKTEEQKRAEEVARKAEEEAKARAKVEAAKWAKRRAVEAELRYEWHEEMIASHDALDDRLYLYNESEAVAASMQRRLDLHSSCMSKHEEFYATLCPLNRTTEELKKQQIAGWPAIWPDEELDK